MKSCESNSACLILGLDATNIRGGGGRTHLIEFLRAANPTRQGIKRVIIWGSKETLRLIEGRSWLVKKNPSQLEGGLLQRALWQRFSLASDARAAKCNLLFVPGGSYGGNFHPVVTMSRNMLPFNWQELRRFGWSLTTLRYLLLRLVQVRSFRNADGVIFLTEYARKSVLEVTGPLSGKLSVIPHGLNPRFLMRPRPQLTINNYSAEAPFRILYVSTINYYKHQWNVVEAVAQLREETGWQLSLTLVGRAHPPALKHLRSAFDRFDPGQNWAKYLGPVSYDQLHTFYGRANVSVFASTCETFGQILIESMSSGLPIACANSSAMPELLGTAGLYFDPERPEEIARALKQLIESPDLRWHLAQAAYDRAFHFTWERCADESFVFLSETYRSLYRSSRHPSV